MLNNMYVNSKFGAGRGVCGIAISLQRTMAVTAVAAAATTNVMRREHAA